MKKMHNPGKLTACIVVAALCGLFASTASATLWFLDVCGTATVNGVPTSNVVVTAWGCENEVVSNDVVFASTVSDGQVSNNYHLIYTVEIGQEPGGRAIDGYLVFSYADCEPVIVPCDVIHDLNAATGGKILLDVDIPCFSDGGDARTPGYWQSKHGKRLINQHDLLPMLNECCLRDADGNHKDFDNFKQFRAWLKGRNAENMAYQLSGHLAAMKLNIAVGYVGSGDLIYAPGCSDDEGDYVTIGSVVDLADEALCENGLTVDSGDDRDYQECLKNALDAANNNHNWVEL